MVGDPTSTVEEALAEWSRLVNDAASQASFYVVYCKSLLDTDTTTQV
jgi:hypothetical protein